MYLNQNIAYIRNSELTVHRILKAYDYDEAEILDTFGCNLYDLDEMLKSSRAILTQLRAEKKAEGLEFENSSYVETMLETDSILKDSLEQSYDGCEPIRDLDLVNCYKNINTSIKLFDSFADRYEELEAIRCFSSSRMAKYELKIIDSELKAYINDGKDFEIVDDNSENGYTVYLNENVDENSMN